VCISNNIIIISNIMCVLVVMCVMWLLMCNVCVLVVSNDIINVLMCVCVCVCNINIINEKLIM